MMHPMKDAEIAYPRAFGRTLLEGTRDVTELLLIRHGEPEANLGEAEDGPALDPCLSAAGERQAACLAARLGREGRLNAVYASPRRRARQTAEMIGDRLDVPVVEAYDLREVEFCSGGDTEGTGEASLGPAEAIYTRFEQTGRWDTFPAAELSRALRGRIRRAIDSILLTNPCRRVAIISHAGVINAYLADVYGIERDVFFLPRHGSLSSVRVLGETRVIERLNDTAHLDGAGGDGPDLQMVQPGMRPRETTAARRSRFASFFVVK